MDVRYFFVTDKIKIGEVKVAFCTTHDMVADFFTNSLQGTVFTQNKGKCTQSAGPRKRRRAQESVGKGASANLRGKPMQPRLMLKTGTDSHICILIPLY